MRARLNPASPATPASRGSTASSCAPPRARTPGRRPRASAWPRRPPSGRARWPRSHRAEAAPRRGARCDRRAPTTGQRGPPWLPQAFRAATYSGGWLSRRAPSSRPGARRLPRMPWASSRSTSPARASSGGSSPGGREVIVRSGIAKRPVAAGDAVPGLGEPGGRWAGRPARAWRRWTRRSTPTRPTTGPRGATREGRDFGPAAFGENLTVGGVHRGRRLHRRPAHGGRLVPRWARRRRWSPARCSHRPLAALAYGVLRGTVHLAARRGRAPSRARARRRWPCAPTSAGRP